MISRFDLPMIEIVSLWIPGCEALKHYKHNSN